MAWPRQTNYRRQGNIHRDAREWRQAAAAYEKHLAAKPDDTDIWVQYGHALKEAGDLKAAEVAYRRAVGDRPEDADARVHLAHALKMQSKYTQSAIEYREAETLSDAPSIADELRYVRSKVKNLPVAELQSGVTLYALQDLFGYLKVHQTMSGIQRVQAGVAMHIIDDDVPHSEFILTDASGGLEGGDFWCLSKSDVRAIIDYASGARVERARLTQLINKAERDAQPIRAGRGHTIILLGAFWGLGNTLSSFLPAKWAGARLGAYVYDIIPISHPEFCDADLVRAFSTSLAELCLIVDFVLTISDYTRYTLQDYLRRHGGREIAMATVPLAHSLTGTGDSVDWPKSLQRVQGREYVAYVSTIEGRKNHIYIVNVWKHLIDEGLDVPDLVFVGRKGWRIGGLLDLLEGTENLGGRVHIVHDLTDGELHAVYKNAAFTVFSSFVEGWGLPVGESLVHGTPALASNTASLPEVGGAFSEYMDPYDLKSGVDAARKLLDANYRESLRKNIQENFEPRAWPDVARDFVAKVEWANAQPLVPPQHPRLREGYVLHVADLCDRKVKLANYVRSPLGLVIARSFYHPENAGAWMKGRHGELTFETDLEAGEHVTVYVGLTAAPWAAGCEISVCLDGSDPATLNPLSLPSLDKSQPVAVRGVVGPGGACRLTLEVDGEFHSPKDDAREFVVGLSSLAYAASSNLAARIDVQEAFAFRRAAATL